MVTSFKARDFNVVSALKPCNKIKNRSLNLIPLESYRVHITPKPGTDGSDYINATFLPVSYVLLTLSRLIKQCTKSNNKNTGSQ